MFRRTAKAQGLVEYALILVLVLTFLICTFAILSGANDPRITEKQAITEVAGRLEVLESSIRVIASAIDEESFVFAFKVNGADTYVYWCEVRDDKKALTCWLARR